MHPSFEHNHYLLKRQVLALTGTFRFYAPDGELVLYSQQKMFRLKEDIRAYANEGKSQELLYIQARSIIDFSAAYDVIDSQTQQRLGILRRRGLNSLLRDEWQVYDANERPLGILQEDDIRLALLRRYIANSLVPQNYDLLIGSQRVADFRQRFNLLRYELDLDFSMDTHQQLDRRLGIAAALLLGVIEGRQE